MNGNREDFCRELLDDDHDCGAIDPEGVAARFVSYFGLPGRPTMPVLKALLEDAGFGAVSGAHLDSSIPCSTRPTRSSARRCASR